MLSAIALALLLVFCGGALGCLFGSKIGKPFYPKEDKEVLKAGNVIMIKFELKIKVDDPAARIYCCELLNYYPCDKVAVFYTRTEYLKINRVYTVRKNDDGRVNFEGSSRLTDSSPFCFET